MEKLIIIKYGELSTKKDNINFFLKTLKNNILRVLQNVDIKYDKGRMFIFLDNDSFDESIEKLQKVFGIHDIMTGYKLEEKDFENIKDLVIKLVEEKDFKTFKVETKRSDKLYPITSMEMSRELGAAVLKNKKNVTVDVHNPEVTIYVEVRNNGVYVYFEKIACLGGYPVGTLGKGLLMLSGGIDSPVAGYLTMKRGVKIEAIYFESPPHTSEQAKNKVIELARKLSVYQNEIKLHIVNLTEIQMGIYKNIPHEYLITILRRMMYRISEKIAKNNRCHILINGESIGQVASQTLTSMRVINETIKLPVIRPLACFDKSEIIDIAKKIDTFETSILPYEDCCTIFVPDHPIINPDIKKALEYETMIPYEEMIYTAIKNHEVLKINQETKENFESLL